MAEVDNAIEVNGLHKYFDLPHERVTTVKHKFVSIVRPFSPKLIERQKVLNGVSFTVPKGEFFGVVGRNGSGKSTLLKLLAGIYTPTEGTIHTEGRIVPFIELGVGFNGDLSARDNIYLNGALLGFSRKEIVKRFNDIVEFAELEEFIDKKLKNYSSGMQVRLAFSIATRLAVSDILLIDEVLAVGDADFQRKCFDYFQNLKKEKKTVILVTHDMNAVREYCDQAILIEKGKVIAKGSQEAVATAYTRLFQEGEAVLTDAGQAKRWGNKRAELKTLALSTKKITLKDDHFNITGTVVANERLAGVILGISIMNGAGQRLFGTNTRLLKQSTLDMAKDETVKYDWAIPNIFNQGKYYACPAVVLANGEICDNWDEAIAFEVFNDASTGFPVNPKIAVQVKRQ